MIKKILVISTFVFSTIALFAQNTTYPYIDWKVGWRSTNIDLSKFNASMPARTPAITGPMHAVELSLDFQKKNFMVNSDISIGTRKRIFINSYEQFKKQVPLNDYETLKPYIERNKVLLQPLLCCASS